jgi:hypothetical protein
MSKIALATVVFLVLAISQFCSVISAQTESLNWKIADLDYAKTNNGIGNYTAIIGSLALDSSGNPHISYDGKYMVWTGSSWNVQNVGFSGQLVLDKSGNPHVVYSVGKYYNQSAGLYLWDIFYSSLSGSQWTTETVATQLAPDPMPKLAFDSSSSPHVAYNRGIGNLMYASKNGTSWSSQIVDTENSYSDLCLAIDANNNPHIVYARSSQNNNAMSIASWTDSKWVIQKVDGYANSASIALDSTGNPHIFYFSYTDRADSYWNYATWNGSTWDIQTQTQIYSTPEGQTSLAIDSHGQPHVGFSSIYSPENKSADSGILEYAVYTGSSWDTQTVENDPGGVGLLTTLALDSADQPHILCAYQATYYQHGSYSPRNAFYAKYASLQDLPSITAIPTLQPTATSAIPTDYHFETPDPSQIRFIMGTVETIAIAVLLVFGVFLVVLVVALVVFQRKLKNKPPLT